MQNYFLILLVLALPCSCVYKQDEKAFTTQISDPKSLKHQLIGTWRVQSKLIDSANQGGGATTLNLLKEMRPCDVDDVEILESNGYWHTQEGSTSCQQREPTELAHGDWSITDEKKLTIMFNDGETITYELTELAKNTFTRLSSIKRDGAFFLVKEKLFKVSSNK